MSEFAIDEWNKEKQQRVRKYINKTSNRSIYLRTLKLTELRENLKLYDKSYTNELKKLKANLHLNKEYKINAQTFNIYKQILQNVNLRTKDWNGEFIFIYIPSKSKYLKRDKIEKTNSYAGSESYIYDKMLNIVNQENIKLIDLYSMINNEIEKPLSLYSVHLNKKGYKLVSNMIFKELNN